MIGKLITDTITMCKIVLEYYRELQSLPKRERNNAQKIDNFLEIVTQSIDDNDSKMLEKDTIKREVEKAISDSKNGTVLGIDRIPYKFYKFWQKKYKKYKGREDDPTVKEVKSIAQILVKVYNEIRNKDLYNDDFVLKAMNLLYKKKDRQQIENYRPITLTNTDYKIYTKTIAEKLEKTAHKITYLN